MRNLFAAATLAIAPSFAFAVPLAYDSGSLTINSGVWEQVDLSGTASLTVAGGSVGTNSTCSGPQILTVTGSASVTVNGGDVSCISATPNHYEAGTSIAINGGHVGGLFAYENPAEITITGGLIDFIDDALSNSMLVNISGGQIGSIGTAYEQPTYNFFGYGFQIECTGYSSLNPSRCARSDILTGFWADGTAFSTLISGDDGVWDFLQCTLSTCDPNERQHTGLIRLFTVDVPEPDDMALFAAGLIALSWARRRQAAIRHA